MAAKTENQKDGIYLHVG